MLMIWNQIERWLQEANKEAYDQLPGPASNRHINHMEDLTGISLPADIEESYKIHDGTWALSLFPEGPLMTIQAIEEEWSRWNELLHDGVLSDTPSNPVGPIKPVHWNSRWLPLTEDGGGNHYCADFDPDAEGTMGQIIWFHHEIGPVRVVACGFRQWLSQFSSDLTNGRYKYETETPWQVSYVDETA